MNQKTEIGRCRDCKWWGYKVNNKYFPHLKECELQHHCDPDSEKPFYAWCDDSDNKERELDCGIDGHLLTGPDFGCVHWEEKECTK